tara:strand:+ start:539 stop:1744 length:1206 start_codon:yes stop_codon:yes gene_type:complete
MNIGIYFETSKSTGGAHHQNIKLIDIFKKHLSVDHDFIYIVPNEEQKKIIDSSGSKSILFKKNLRFKIEQFFFKFSFFREIYKKLSITNKFEKFLLSKKFDLIFFNSPYEISLLLNDINFIIMLLSMQHRTHGFFPEYKSTHDNEIRDKIIDNAVKKSFKIFVGASKDKELLVKFFNAEENKIIVQPYTFTLPNLYNENTNHDYEKSFKSLEIPEKKNILIYPAQFWAHKNHKYIIDVAKDLKERKIDDIFFIFSGFDKGNLNYIKAIIKKNELNGYVKIFNYLDDFQLISLYLKCFGVIMPSFVGHTTIPMYEAFFFKKNIFYTKDLSDNNLRNHLTEIDINQVSSFLEKYNDIKNNELLNNKKLNEAKLFFEKYCDEKIIGNNFKKVFKEYKQFKDTWY